MQYDPINEGLINCGEGRWRAMSTRPYSEFVRGARATPVQLVVRVEPLAVQTVLKAVRGAAVRVPAALRPDYTGALSVALHEIRRRRGRGRGRNGWRRSRGRHRRHRWHRWWRHLRHRWRGLLDTFVHGRLRNRIRVAPGRCRRRRRVHAQCPVRPALAQKRRDLVAAAQVEFESKY